MSPPRIVIYTLSTCPWCRKAKQWFTAQDIDFEYVDVDLLPDDESDRVAREVYDFSGSRSFPVVRIGETWVVGFRPERYTELLGRR